MKRSRGAHCQAAVPKPKWGLAGRFRRGCAGAPADAGNSGAAVGSGRQRPISTWLSRSSFRLVDSSVLASVTLTTSPPAFILLTRLNRFRVVHHPSGLGNTRSTLHGSCSPVPHRLLPRQYRSASRARLDTGGWLALARQGLSPCKKVLAEIGADLSRFKDAKHFASWLGLCPGTKISRGKIISAATAPSTNRAAQALKMAASNLRNSQSALGAY